MSASGAVTLRLHHLEQAARILFRTSPSISGHLRSAQHRLATGEGRALSTPEGLQVCSACGSSLIPGWNCEPSASKTPTKKRTRQDRLRKQDSFRVIDVRCSRCDSTTKFKAVKLAAVNEQKSEVRLPSKLPPAKSSTAQPLDIPKPSTSGTATATSAARKRSRNKKSSLQSMLENRKPPAQTQGFGLDLADFMR